MFVITHCDGRIKGKPPPEPAICVLGVVNLPGGTKLPLEQASKEMNVLSTSNCYEMDSTSTENKEVTEQS
jgi:hypothetical protein